MTNKHTHQIHAIVFFSQSHSGTEQILVSSGPIQTTQRTKNGGVAGMLRSHTLPHQAGSRVSARLPADQTGEWPRQSRPINPCAPENIRTRPHSVPTQSRLSGSTGGRASHQRRGDTLLQFDSIHKKVSRANTPRPNTGTNSHPSGHTTREHTPIDPDNTQKAFTHAQRPPRGVLQDKGVLTNAASASLQPAPDTKSIRVQSANNTVVRSESVSRAGRKSGRITLWGLEPAITNELERISAEEGMSLSLIGKTALTQWVHQSLHDKHEDTLYPVIRSLVREENRTLGNRLVFFQMRTAFASEQTRILTTNILSRFLKYLGVPDETFNNLVDQSNKMAKRNIIARNPDFKFLIEEWWQTEPDENADEKPNVKSDHKPQLNKPNRKEKKHG